jgi:hypothetical protein
VPLTRHDNALTAVCTPLIGEAWSRHHTPHPRARRQTPHKPHAIGINTALPRLCKSRGAAGPANADQRRRDPAAENITVSADALSGDPIPLYRQVSRYGQPPPWGAVLGCIPP